jgi:carbonic anhydrase
MRLFEAILDANHRALAGDEKAGLHLEQFPDSLPVVALTCIDPRLNSLLPNALGLPAEQFIWLRNAGNIVSATDSSTMRALALACSIKGGKEIFVIGHTDCRVRQTSVAQLTDHFRALGIDRSRLPDNLTEFFGLFASERQNVLKGVELVRQSPLIGPRIPVHGLLVDVETGKLESLVNGYETLPASVSEHPAGLQAGPSGPFKLENLPGFKLGEMKFPDFKIGEAQSVHLGETSHVSPAAKVVASPKSPEPASGPDEAKPSLTTDLRLPHDALFKIVGNDQKIYGPVSGRDLEQWLRDTRVHAASLAQRLGYKEWKPLAHFAETLADAAIPIPPPVLSARQLRKPR